MNDLDHDRQRAADAQLDWLLDEAAGADRVPDLTERVLARVAAGGGAGRPGGRAAGIIHCHRYGRRRVRFAAAVVLLGVFVVVAALWTRADGVGQPAVTPWPPSVQDPAQVDRAGVDPVWHDVSGPTPLAADARAFRLIGNPRDRVGIVRWLQRTRGPQVHRLAIAATGGHEGLDPELSAAIAELSGLVELRLDHAGACPPAALRTLGRLPQLRTLSLTGCHVGDAGAAELAQLPVLQQLDLSFDVSLIDAGLEHLSRMPDLRQLSLVGCSGLTGAGIAQLGRLPRLERLDLSCVNGRVLGGGRGARTDLWIHAGAESVVLASQALEAHQYLDDRAGGVDDEALAALARSSSLRELVLTGCPAISPAGLGALAALPLRELALSLPGDGEPYAAALPPTLEHLSLRCSPGVGDAGVLAAIERLPRLAALDVSLTRVTPAGIAGALKRRPLRRLALSSCPGIDATVVPVLAVAASLEHLQLGGYRWLQAGQREQLMALPNLVELDTSDGLPRITGR